MRSTCFEARGLGGFVKAMCVGMLMMRRTMRRTMRKRMRKDEKGNEDRRMRMIDSTIVMTVMMMMMMISTYGRSFKLVLSFIGGCLGATRGATCRYLFRFRRGPPVAPSVEVHCLCDKPCGRGPQRRPPRQGPKGLAWGN